jgi:hypothetical protein
MTGSTLPVLFLYEYTVLEMLSQQKVTRGGDIVCSVGPGQQDMGQVSRTPLTARSLEPTAADTPFR